MARHPTAHGDSADVPWSGRELSPSGFETDAGGADPVLRTLLADAASDAELMAAIATSRFLIPVVAAPVEITETEAGLHADSTVDLAMVTLTGPDGERALPVFTGTDSLAAWDPQARPVPVTPARMAQAAVSERCDVLVVDLAGPTSRTLRPSMVWALAQQRPWSPAHEDEHVERSVAAAVAAEADVTAFALADGGGGELRVELTVRPGLDRAAVTALVTRIGERLATDGELRARIDGLAFRLA